ncbi:helix-turn-helix domain-containing protein [Enterobacter roggenkampii]|uniref:winged helix-turn-helix transcriptional regulator n=1 Tax=Enterobacter roggenkampii TaxID=1812935 RepID=UPI001A8E0D27|nr:helix-turn-helix domain-containing protein [Enterobacter roggenkampii]EKS6941420.1 helix-turn-helix transcriptional regulator [Enterobacter roggenkampii]MBN9706721.1 helix-turn-helix transcriptional regulator [Enterobacter roggenkampii]MCK7252631.1 helix-turn-helix transcriptional regulator [Enterobacter roggenkampii]WGG56593.1 helix-turn-helix domain-containing protein [Enterobacter roggenkampii]HCM9671707.1 helix-turn-helix transcriptional regulator [Enterobacter roggenkampii]
MSKNKSLPYLFPELCGLAAAAELLGDQWVLLILREAFYGVTRFETIRDHTKITRQTLANRLKKMTELGLLCKIPYQEEGARERYEYVLTAKSRSLAPILFSLMEWGHKNILHDAPHIALTDKESGEVVNSAYVTVDGKFVDPKNVRLTFHDSQYSAAMPQAPDHTDA